MAELWELDTKLSSVDEMVDFDLLSFISILFIGFRT